MIRVFKAIFGGSRRIGTGVFDLLNPSVCRACERPLPRESDVFCPVCWDEFRGSLGGIYCPTCGHDAGPYSLMGNRCHRCQGRRPVVGCVVRVGAYRDTLRELILSLKFRRRGHLDQLLGGMLAQAVLGNSELCRADWLIPIPLHWRRRMSRGYNQAELIGRAAAAELEKHHICIPIGRDLIRVRNTPAQTSLSRTERMGNLRGAFAVREGHDYRGKHVCLIDDVTTTGTTLREAGKALRKAGVAKVSAAVAAVAAND